MSEISDDDLQALERRLLTDPFNAGLRADYAGALLAQGRTEAAAQQAQLLQQQAPRLAAGTLLQARLALAGGDAREALAAYEQARVLEGFTPDEALEALAAQAVPQAGGPRPASHLQLVGGKGAEVRALQSVSEERVRFSSIVGMEALKKTVRVKIIEPYLKPGLFERFRMGSGGGILLYGPPGCGKTMLARAIANECQAGFISVGVSDVLTMWLGESERNLAALFEKARHEAPCVLFFDELDALAYARSKAGSASARTVVNEFLAQMDGFGRDNKGVLILAATNMPWDVDDAMKRPGRFSRQIFVAPPDLAARRQMLEIKLTGVPAEGLDLDRLAARCEHFSGADIDGLIEQAKEFALVDNLHGEERGLSATDFDQALETTRPSTLDWLRTVGNVVKYAGSDGTYREVEKYLKQVRLL